MLNDVELPHQAITASRASGVPAPAEADLNFLKDQPLLGFGGLASEVQNEQSGPVRLDRAQVEVNPLLGDKTSRTPPLQPSTDPMEAEEVLPFRV